MLTFSDILATIQSLPTPSTARIPGEYQKKAALYCAILAVGASIPKLTAFTDFGKEEIFPLLDRLHQDNLLATGTLAESYVRSFVKGGDDLIDQIVGKTTAPTEPAATVQAAIAAQTGRFTIPGVAISLPPPANEQERKKLVQKIWYRLRTLEAKGVVRCVQPGNGTYPAVYQHVNEHAPVKAIKPAKSLPAPIAVAAEPEPIVAPAPAPTQALRFGFTWAQGDNQLELNGTLHLDLASALTGLNLLISKATERGQQ